MTTTFHYKHVPGALDGQKRPNIPIILKAGDLGFETVGLLDSGADNVVIPLSVAEALGLDLTGERIDTGGIGGSAESIQSSITMKVTKGSENNMYFQVPVLVLNRKDDFPVLLGRKGFFSRYVITIDEQEKRVTLKPKNMTGVKY